MKIEENCEKYLWILTVVFVTFLLIGSFTVSGNYMELAYVFLLNVFNLYIVISNRKK